MRGSTKSHLPAGAEYQRGTVTLFAVFQSRARPRPEWHVVQSAFADLKRELQCETSHVVRELARTQLLVWGERAFCSAVEKRWTHVPTLDFMETKAAVWCAVWERASVPSKSCITLVCCVTGDILDP